MRTTLKKDIRYDKNMKFEYGSLLETNSKKEQVHPIDLVCLIVILKNVFNIFNI